jgi:hypothetical protein
MSRQDEIRDFVMITATQGLRDLAREIEQEPARTAQVTPETTNRGLGRVTLTVNDVAAKNPKRPNRFVCVIYETESATPSEVNILAEGVNEPLTMPGAPIWREITPRAVRDYVRSLYERTTS